MVRADIGLNFLISKLLSSLIQFLDSAVFHEEEKQAEKLINDSFIYTEVLNSASVIKTSQRWVDRNLRNLRAFLLLVSFQAV